MRMRMSKFMRISADADPDAELRYTSKGKYLEKYLNTLQKYLNTVIKYKLKNVFKYSV